MLTLLALAIGAFLGFAAVKSGTFREGGGLVLLFICVVAMLVAAAGGALSAFLPTFVSVWTGRIALGCVAFVVTTCTVAK
jgi:hypothetical protein